MKDILIQHAEKSLPDCPQKPSGGFPAVLRQPYLRKSYGDLIPLNDEPLLQEHYFDLVLDDNPYWIQLK